MRGRQGNGRRYDEPLLLPQDKADLIAAMDDALMGEVLLPSLPATGASIDRDRIPNTRCLLAHPGCSPPCCRLPRRQRDAPHGTMPAGACWDTMTTREKLALLTIIDDFVFGYALREARSDRTSI